MDEGYGSYPQLARRSGSGFVILDEYWERSTGGRDIAITHLRPDGNLSPVGANALGAGSTSVSDDHLFVQGYPDQMSQSSALLLATASETQPYITYESETPTTFDPAVHFEIEWDPTKPQVDETGQAVFLPSAKGVSGAPVWTLGSSGGARSVPAGARIIGVAHQFHEERRSLIVVRIEEVRRFALQAIRRRAAYLNWCGRHRPTFDADVDWALAERQIPRLW